MTNEPIADRRGGRGIVIGALLLALLLGGGAIFLRAWMRLRRGRYTTTRVLAKLESDGLLGTLEPARAPDPERDARLDARLRSILEDPDPPALIQAARLLAALPNRRLADRKRHALLTAKLSHGLEQQLLQDGLTGEDNRALQALLAELEQQPGLSRSMERELREGLARLDALEDQYRAAHWAPAAMLRLAEAADIRASYVRVLGTGLEISRGLPYPQAMALLAKARQLAAHQGPRTTDTALLIFPDLQALLEQEALMQGRLRLMRRALKLCAEHKTRPASIVKDAELRDPFDGQPFRYETLGTDEARLFSAKAEQLSLRLRIRR